MLGGKTFSLDSLLAAIAKNKPQEQQVKQKSPEELRQEELDKYYARNIVEYKEPEQWEKEQDQLFDFHKHEERMKKLDKISLNKGMSDEDKKQRMLLRKHLKHERRIKGIDVSDDDIDPDAVQKTGYELTDYMKVYNSRTAMDYTKGYDPKKMDEHYLSKEELLYEKHNTMMPNQVGFTFDYKAQGLEIKENEIEEIRESFFKF